MEKRLYVIKIDDVSLASGYFVSYDPPKLTLRLSVNDATKLRHFRHHAKKRSVLNVQLERRGKRFWMSPSFRARVLVASEKTMELKIGVSDGVDLSCMD